MKKNKLLLPFDLAKKQTKAEKLLITAKVFADHYETLQYLLKKKNKTFSYWLREQIYQEISRYHD